MRKVRNSMSIIMGENHSLVLEKIAQHQFLISGKSLATIATHPADNSPCDRPGDYRLRTTDRIQLEVYHPGNTRQNPFGFNKHHFVVGCGYRKFRRR